MRAAAVRGPQPQAGHLPGHHQQAGGTGYVDIYSRTLLVLFTLTSDLLSNNLYILNILSFTNLLQPLFCLRFSNYALLCC